MRYVPALAAAALIVAVPAAPAAHAAEVPAAVGLFTIDDTIATVLIDDSQDHATYFLDRAELSSRDTSIEFPLTMDFAERKFLADGAVIEIELHDATGPGALTYDGPETLRPGETTDVAIRADSPGTYTGALRLTTTLDSDDYVHSDLPFRLTFGAEVPQRKNDSNDADSVWDAWVDKGPRTMARDINGISQEINRLDRELTKLQKYAPATTTTRAGGAASGATGGSASGTTGGAQTSQGQRGESRPAAPVAGEPTPAAADAGGAGGASGASGGVAPAAGAAAPGVVGPVAPAPDASVPVTEETTTEQPPLIPADEGGDVISTQSAQPTPTTAETATVQAASAQSDRLLEGAILGAGAAALLVGLLKFAMTLGELRESRRRDATY